MALASVAPLLAAADEAPPAAVEPLRRAYMSPAPSYPADGEGLATHRSTFTPEAPHRTPLAGYNRTMGDHKAIMLLVDFQDITHAAASNLTKYNAFANANNSTDKSLRTFLYENSAGNYTLNVTVVDWVTMPQNMNYYSTTSGENKIAVDATNAADSVVDFSLFDEDGDGYIDNLIVVHAGNDQAVTANTSEIWSFEGSGNTATRDGKTVKRFLTVAEDIGNGDPLGVLCHEFGHLGFDLPDLYDVDNINAGLGDWDTMGTGGWAGGGNQPNGFSAWTKLALGWISPYAPQYAVDGYVIYPMTNTSARNPVKLESNYTNEYFLVEFRWRNTSLRFDRYVPTSGLVIYHINETTIANNWSANTIETNTQHKGIDVEEVGTQDMDTGNTGNSNDVWVNNTSGFGPSSTPNSNLYRNSGNYVTGIRVFNISTVNLTGGAHMNFSIDTGRGTSNLSATLSGNASQTVAQGGSANYTVQFSTTSGSGDNVTVTGEGSFGGANVSLNRSSIALAANGTGSVTLTVTLLATCTFNTFVDVTVRGNSSAQPNQTAAVATRTTCGQTFAGNLSGPTAINATAGTPAGQNFSIQNTGNGMDFYALNFTVNATLVNATVNLTGFNILPGATASFRVNFTVAPSVADGTVIPYSVEGAFGASGLRRVYLNGSITARSNSIAGAVLNNGTNQTALPGASASFLVQFSTASGAGDNLTLSVEGSFGAATVSLNRSSMTLAANGSGLVNLTVTLGSGCAAGTSVDVWVRANSTNQPGVSLAVATRTTCAQVYLANWSGLAAFNATTNSTVAQNYTLTNAGNGADLFNVTISFNGSLVNITWSPSGASLGGGVAAAFRLNFTMAAGLPDATVVPFSIDAAFGPSGARHAYLNGTITARSFAVAGSLLGGNATVTALPGTPANFTIQFTTASGAGDFLALATEGSFGGAVVGLNRSSMSLGPAGSGSLILQVTLPASCTAGSFVDVLVRANSTNQSTATAAVATRTVCAQVFAANVSGATALSALVNTSFSQNFSVSNGGNGADNVSVVATANASLLALSVSSASFALPAGGASSLRIDFLLAAGVADGALVPFALDIAYGPGGTRHAILNGTVTARSFRITAAVIGSGTVQSAQPGLPVNFTVRFATASAAGDALDFSTEGLMGGALVALNRSSALAGPLGSVDVMLQVTMPANCTLGDFVDVRVRANSTGDPASTAALATRTVCGVVYGGSLVGPAAVEVFPGTPLAVAFIVQNDGSGLDDFLVAGSAASPLTVGTPAGALPLFGGASFEVEVTFALGSATLAGTQVPFSLVLSFGPGGAGRGYLNGTVTAGRVGGVAVAVDAAAEETVLPGASRTFNVSVENRGNFDALANLSAQVPSGFAAAWEASSVQVPAFSSAVVRLTVSAAVGSAADARALTALTVDLGGLVAGATVTLVVAHVFEVHLAGSTSASGIPGAAVVVDLSATNGGNGLDNATVVIEAAPAGWSATVSPPTIALAPGAAARVVSFRATVPAGLAAGTGASFTVTLRSEHAGTVSSVTIAITVDPLRSFISLPTLPAGPIEGTANVSVAIENRGNIAESYRVEALGLPSTWTAPSAQTVSVGAGETLVVWMNATAPAAALGGTVSFTLRVTVVADPSRFSTMPANVTVAARHAIALEVPALSGNFSRGTEVFVNITVRNLGNVEELIAVVASAGAADVAVFGSPVGVRAFGEAKVQVRVRLKGDQAAGDLAVLLSATAAPASASGTLHIEVAPPSGGGPPPAQTGESPSFFASPLFIVLVAGAAVAAVALSRRRKRGAKPPST